MGVPRLSSTSKSSPVWILISAVPPLIGTIAAVLYVLSSDNKNKAYSLLFLIPIIGPIIAYVLMEQKDRYISSMAGWVFLGQILGYIILDALIVLH